MNNSIDTNPEELFKFAKTIDGFLTSMNHSLREIERTMYDVSQYWRGAQANEFQNYVEDYKKDLRKQLGDLENVKEKIVEQGKVLKELRDRRLT